MRKKGPIRHQVTELGAIALAAPVQRSQEPGFFRWRQGSSRSQEIWRCSRYWPKLTFFKVQADEYQLL